MLAATAASASIASIAPNLHLAPEERADLARIEAYLNSFDTVRSGFAQRSSNGEQAQGNLYLSRPGKLRIEYQPPTPILVVANGTFLIYYDRNLEQVSYVPLASTPASILLEKRFSLSDGTLLVTGFERSGKTILVTLERKDAPGEGSLTLTFATEPLRLEEWSVTDAQGIVTLVTLIEPKFDVELDRALFVFQDPRPPAQQSP